jgi:hypothetical protein
MFKLNSAKYDLATLIRKQNPEFTAPLNEWEFAMLTTETDMPGNTSVVISTANGGLLRLYYDRIDLAAVSATQVDLPLVEEELYRLSDFLDELLATTGVYFILGGVDNDIDDIEFLAPTRGGSMTLELIAAETSVRFVPGSVCSITIRNKGLPLFEFVDQRSLTATTSGGCIKAGLLVPLNDVRLNPMALLRSVDFSAILSDKIGEALLSMQIIDNGVWEFSLYPDIFTAINAQLTTLGIPLLQSPVVYRGDEYSDITTFFNAWVLSTANPVPAWVNTNFRYCVKISPIYAGQLDTPAAYATDYYLHFN